MPLEFFCFDLCKGAMPWNWNWNFRFSRSQSLHGCCRRAACVPRVQWPRRRIGDGQEMQALQWQRGRRRSVLPPPEASWEMPRVCCRGDLFANSTYLHSGAQQCGVFCSWPPRSCSNHCSVALWLAEEPMPKSVRKDSNVKRPRGE